ncbi:cyclin-domain-containing protein, partial [Patellaria atrata CBS 101060]
EPPPPPNPSADTGVIPPIASPRADIPSPPVEGGWDVATMEAETAMKILTRTLAALASFQGDVPPTPPLSRPSTPTMSSPSNNHSRRRSVVRPATPVPSDDMKAPTFKEVEIGSPEACASEPAAGIIGHGAEPINVQQQAIARKFFSRRPPTVPLEDYAIRLQRFCPMSTAVWLAAGVYIHKLVIEEKLVPLTPRTVHRLMLASLRVGMKALEDLRYPQARFAAVGGVRESELHMLEISLCYLTNFDLQVTCDILHDKTMALQQAAVHVTMLRNRVPASFQPKLP